MKRFCEALCLGLLWGSSAAAQDPVTRTHAEPRQAAQAARHEDWPGFLGPRRDGTSSETHLLDAWGQAGPTLLWERSIGSGFSSPVTSGGRLVLTHRVADQEFVECLEAKTGRSLWRRGFPCDFVGEFISDHGPRSTPLIDGEWLFVHSVDGVMRCLELASGKLRWEADWDASFELPEAWFGVVSSPLVHGDLLIQNLGEPKSGSVAAFHKATGKLVWSTSPAEASHAPWGASCASPVIASCAGRERLFVITGGKSRPPRGGLMVLDPKTGALEFSFPFRSREYYSVNASSPLVIGDGVLLSASYGVGSVFLELPGEAAPKEAPSQRVRWKNRRLGLQFGNPISMGEKLYMADGSPGGRGSLTVLDPKSGAVLFDLDLEHRAQVGAGSTAKWVESSSGEASLAYADGKLFCLGDDGTLFLVDIEGELPRLLAASALFHARWSWTPPVLTQGLLYIRQSSEDELTGSTPRLLCYDLRATH